MMNRNTMMWVLAAVLVGCGSNSSTGGVAGPNPDDGGVVPGTPASPAETPSTPTDTTTPTDPTTPVVGDAADPDHAYLRVLGVANPGYSLFSLEAAQVQVWVDGEPVAVDGSDVVPMNLADADKAYLAGRFALPPAGAEVRVRLAFDEYGAYDGPPGAGAIDARGLPIEFTVASDLFLWRHHATLWLDLSRSLASATCLPGCGEGELALLPALEVFFY